MGFDYSKIEKRWGKGKKEQEWGVGGAEWKDSSFQKKNRITEAIS